MHRLFFALWPDDALRREIEAIALQQACQRGGRAVRADRYHLTLLFMGDFEACTESMHASLLAAAGAIPALAPFELLLDRVGAFGAGRVLWLGCSDPPPQLVQLHRSRGDALARSGIAPESGPGFVPHVTLQRNVLRPVEGPIPPLRWRVSSFVLVDSTGGEYHVVGRWTLRDDDVRCESRNPASR